MLVPGIFYNKGNRCFESITFNNLQKHISQFYVIECIYLCLPPPQTGLDTRSMTR